mgnify:FL=1|jgi:hypothetical protein
MAELTAEQREELHQANKRKIEEIRKLDPSFDMAYQLGSLQARAKFAMHYMRMASNNVKNRYVRAMLRRESNELRKFLVEECKMDIPFDARYDV